jgi:hypothetical protein
VIVHTLPPHICGRGQQSTKDVCCCPAAVVLWGVHKCQWPQRRQRSPQESLPHRPIVRDRCRHDQLRERAPPKNLRVSYLAAGGRAKALLENRRRDEGLYLLGDLGLAVRCSFRPRRPSERSLSTLPLFRVGAEPPSRGPPWAAPADIWR